MQQNQHAFLQQFFQLRVDNQMVDALCNATTKLLQLAPPNPLSLLLPSLPWFVGQLVNDSQISPAVIYVALYYIQMLGKRLSPQATGLSCTAHRIVLASIIISEKMLCDVSMKNISWAIHSRFFSLQEVNLMERELLSLLVTIWVNKGL